MPRPLLSIIIPVYNEAPNVQPLYDRLLPIVQKVARQNYEILYIDDGSSDDTAARVGRLRSANKHVKLLKLSRHFGKELALAAGIRQAEGQAVLMLDGDGQHPVELIPDFMKAWKAGAKVVVGIRISNQNEGLVKKLGSKLFYGLFNRLSDDKLIPGSSDFRLIDHVVQQAFCTLNEPTGITRGLIDWLGFERSYITYQAEPRTSGAPGYKFSHLVKLAADSLVSLSLTPLYLSGYLGTLITAGSLLLGIFIIIEQLVLGDPLHLKFTGTAMLAVLTLFLVGLVLIAQGIMALYISHIHNQSKGRPLFVIDYDGSKGINVNKI